MRSWIDDAREHVRTILAAALAAASPQPLMRRCDVRDGDLILPDGARVRFARRRVRLAAVGKAAAGMAAHAQRWGRFDEAVVVAPAARGADGSADPSSAHDAGIPEFECLVGEHPVPGQGSLAAGSRLLELARSTGPDDLLVLLLSGGASALAEVPLVPLADLVRTQELLLASATPIEEVNVVRKHLSAIKGGRLAQACAGELLVLAISDVPPGELSTLGSGPAAPDPSTYGDALRILRERGLVEAVPNSVRQWLDEGARGMRSETPKPRDPCFARVRTHVLADNEAALRAAARAAAELGYDTHVLFGFLRGEARDRGRELAEIARERTSGVACYVAGGETVVDVRGHGKGGRNQEVTLAAVAGLSARDAVLACFATDGVDGPTDAAGAVVDGRTLTRAQAMGLDAQAHLEENDAYAFFEPLDDLIRTGPTGTNVRDVAVLIVNAVGVRARRAPAGAE